jgi:hypothetical protein
MKYRLNRKIRKEAWGRRDFEKSKKKPFAIAQVRISRPDGHCG